MPTCSINKTCILFSDDTNIISSDYSANKLKVKLQLKINIMLWVKSNELIINIDKTHCISFINYIEFEIAIENKPIVKLSEKKLLRLIIDNSVQRKSHFQFLKNKLLTLYWIIKNVSFWLNESAMIILYYVVFYSHLIYCLEMLRHTYKSNIDCIHVIQKKVFN